VPVFFGGLLELPEAAGEELPHAAAASPMQEIAISAPNRAPRWVEPRCLDSSIIP
jgi:hypothetical protein